MLSRVPYALGLALVAAVILAVNVPFGYWRAGLRKFSPLWFVAVHAPVPLAVAVRLLAGFGFRLVTLPIFVAAYFAGQLLGARLRGRREGRADVGARTAPR